MHVPTAPQPIPFFKREKVHMCHGKVCGVSIEIPHEDVDDEQRNFAAVCDNAICKAPPPRFFQPLTREERREEQRNLAAKWYNKSTKEREAPGKPEV